MASTITTKLTAGGQTTVPKAIRNALGIEDEGQVWWRLDDGKATITAEPPVPNEVSSPQEFWDGIDRAMRDVEAGKTRDAGEISKDLRKKYGLA